MRLKKRQIGVLSLSRNLVCVFLLACISTAAQKPNERRSAACYREDVLPVIEEQASLTRSFDQMTARIAVLVRAADMLWSYHRSAARAAFAEAFELAIEAVNETSSENRVEGTKGLVVIRSDQRYQVITAVARRDPEWARKLSESVLKEEGSLEAETREGSGRDRTGEKLLLIATRLLDSNQAVALVFAQRSLGYKANLFLPTFLYRLAATNPEADRFYREAVTAYANSPVKEFLYLSAFPFGFEHAVGEMVSWTTYIVPSGFKPKPALQRIFVEALLKKTRLVTSSRSPGGGDELLSDAGQFWIALNRLSAEIATTCPDLAPSVRQALETLYPTLSPSERQHAFDLIAAADTPKESFDERIERAEREPLSDKRDHLFAIAVLNLNEGVPFERIVESAERIADPEVRIQLLDWLYFNRAQLSIRKRELDGAQKLATKISALDQRAYLYLEIATASLKSNDGGPNARISLDEIASSAKQAPDTNTKARTLLGIAAVLASADVSQALSALSQAVATLNRIESPDLSRESIVRKVEGKTFALYATVHTPSFSPETSFREVSQQDFEGTLYLANNIRYKPLRALITLALLERCLETSRDSARPRSKKFERWH